MPPAPHPDILSPLLCLSSWTKKMPGHTGQFPQSNRPLPRPAFAAHHGLPKHCRPMAQLRVCPTLRPPNIPTLKATPSTSFASSPASVLHSSCEALICQFQPQPSSLPPYHSLPATFYLIKHRSSTDMNVGREGLIMIPQNIPTPCLTCFCKVSALHKYIQF